MFVERLLRYVVKAPSKAVQEHKYGRRSERSWVESGIGVVLLDWSYKPVVFNREAAFVLTYPEVPNFHQETVLRIPDEILVKMREWFPINSASLSTSFLSGRRAYVCQSYLLESYDHSLGDVLLALLLRRIFSPAGVIDGIGTKFFLTDREREVLTGISMGLSSKELAQRMNISPNTVKTHIRVMMVKMGVSTRGAILAKLLEHTNICSRALDFSNLTGAFS